MSKAIPLDRLREISKQRTIRGSQSIAGVGLTGEMIATPAPNPPDPLLCEDRRTCPRIAVAMPAFLRASGERHSVHLLDLSAGGAKLNCSALLPTGTAVVLDCGTIGRSAAVRWQAGGELGLCFDSELDAREITALIARSIALASLMHARE